MYRYGRTSIALLVAVAIHIIVIIIIGFKMINTKEQGSNEYLSVSWVKAPSPKFKQVREPLLAKPIKKRFNPERAIERKTNSEVGLPVVKQTAQTVKKSPEPIKTNVQLSESTRKSLPISGPTTEANVESLDNYTVAASRNFSSRNASTGRGIPAINQIRKESRGSKSSGIESLLSSTGTGDLEGGVGDIADLIKIPDNKLGAVLVGEGSDIEGFIRIVRLKHSFTDWWQDPSALPSLFAWLKEHTRFRADMKIKEGALRLTNPRIFKAPLVIMTGHDQEVTISRNLMTGHDQYVPKSINRDAGPLRSTFSDAERIALRKYIIDYKGTLFFDDCGFNGLFAAKVKHELERIFPEYPLVDIPHNHEIYNIYYHLPGPPTGGDVFWGTENNPHVSLFKYQKGITINGRLAVIYNRKDYLCSMETMEIPSRTMLRMRRSTDVHRFMTNLFVYVMKYGGNVDRSSYTRR